MTQYHCCVVYELLPKFRSVFSLLKSLNVQLILSLAKLNAERPSNLFATILFILPFTSPFSHVNKYFLLKYHVYLCLILFLRSCFVMKQNLPCATKPMLQ